MASFFIKRDLTFAFKTNNTFGKRINDKKATFPVSNFISEGSFKVYKTQKSLHSTKRITENQITLNI